jgi:oligopeptide/dipeptide ABC transporter ATP-binding protein
MSPDARDLNPRAAPGEGEVVRLESVTKYFRDAASLAHVRAVDGVSLSVNSGEALGLVGESGSGKSTLARCLLRLNDVTSGSIFFNGEDVTRARGRALRSLRSQIQMVFQDPAGSLDPRQRVRSVIEEPLKLLVSLTADEREDRIREAVELVHLQSAHLDRYPHQLSGGQQQRVGIARALVLRPRLCVLDEPTSALDAPIRSDILELLNQLRSELTLSYLFISHDLSAVRRACDRVSVMYLGRLVEEAPVDELFASPRHPYTKALLSAILEPNLTHRRQRLHLGGEPASPIDPPEGCHLHPRCPIAIRECALSSQAQVPLTPRHSLACMRVTNHDPISWPTGWDQSDNGPR